jgi:hypothetical protein
MTNSHLTEIREMIDAGLRKHPKGLTAMLELVDDTDESGDLPPGSGWDFRFDDFKAQALQERCGICCVVACQNCPNERCQDRLGGTDEARSNRQGR